MIPVADIASRPAVLFSQDTLTINQGDGNEIHLAQNAFTPGPNLVMGDLVEADFTGSTFKSSNTAPTVGTDPATGDEIVTLPDPVGGWRWVTTALTNLPQTIYGYYLIGTDSGDLWAAVRFDVPFVLTSVGQQIVIGTVTFRFRAQAIS